MSPSASFLFSLGADTMKDQKAQVTRETKEERRKIKEQEDAEDDLRQQRNHEDQIFRYRSE